MRRFLADSNRRTRFCRPLTKPLIQGTLSLAIFVSRLRLQRYDIFFNLQIFCYFFLTFSAFFSQPYFGLFCIDFMAQSELQHSHGLLLFFMRLKYWKIRMLIHMVQRHTIAITIICCNSMLDKQIILGLGLLNDNTSYLEYGKCNKPSQSSGVSCCEYGPFPTAGFLLDCCESGNTGEVNQYKQHVS